MMAHRRVVTRIRGSSAGDREQEPVRIWLLGGFRSSIGPRVIGAERWRLTKAANLIKLLGLAPQHRLHRERVMYTLWPDLDAKRASNNLHRTLHSPAACSRTRELTSG
jgi:DNA-binding SARP family transcriptional activator